MPEPLVVCSRSHLSYRWVQAYSLLSVLLDLVYRVLCCGLRSTWTWVLCRVINRNCLHSSTCWQPVRSSLFVEDALFFPLYQFGFFFKNQVSLCAFVSGSSIWFHWSTCLFLYQNHVTFITIAVQYSLKSGIVISPEVFFWGGGLFACLFFVLFCFYIWSWELGNTFWCSCVKLWWYLYFIQYIKPKSKWILD